MTDDHTTPAPVAEHGLRCPKCGGAMRTYERSGIIVDQCGECRGLFLDRGELERLIDAEAEAAVREVRRRVPDPGRAALPPAWPDRGPEPRWRDAGAEPGFDPGRWDRDRYDDDRFDDDDDEDRRYRPSRRGSLLGDLLDFG